MQCNSNYTASPKNLEYLNLRVINAYKKKFGDRVILGLSDHTSGHLSILGAVALGAKVIEKHFILDKTIGGPDASFSLDKTEFKGMVDAVREAEKSLGTINYSLSEKMEKSRNFSRSLFVVKDMKKGDIFTDENIRSIRPGNGLKPKYLPKILGKKASYNLKKGTPLKFNLIDG